jgi:hypothetical protein
MLIRMKIIHFLAPLFFVLILFTKTYSQETCLKNAWEAFNGQRYSRAIEYCNQCIEDFGRIAHRKQKELDSLKIPEPPVGSVSDAEKRAIFNRGLLNDVATAYWVKGRSAEYLYRRGGQHRDNYKQMTEEAYKEACVLKHGRTWDPKGWFWSPCRAAQERLPLD